MATRDIQYHYIAYIKIWLKLLKSLIISYNLFDYNMKDLQLLSVSTEFSLGIGKLHREMLLLLFGQPRPSHSRSGVTHSHISTTLPRIGVAHAQIPVNLMGLLTG